MIITEKDKVSFCGNGVVGKLSQQPLHEDQMFLISHSVMSKDDHNIFQDEVRLDICQYIYFIFFHFTYIIATFGLFKFTVRNASMFSTVAFVHIIQYLKGHPSLKGALTMRLQSEQVWIYRLKTSAPLGMNVFD